MNELISYLQRYRAVIAVVAVIAVGVAVYVSGLRIGPGLTIARLGTLELTQVPAGAQVFIDYGLRGVTKGDTFEAALMPGTHSVIVSTQDSYPWEEIVTIGSNAATKVDPVIVRKTVPRARLTDATRATALDAIASTTLPAIGNPLSMDCALVYVDANRVIAESATTTPGCTPLPYACTNGTCSPTIVYAPASPIKAVLPYPDHQDAIVVQVGDHLYALEIDPRAPQFFAPLYDGIQLSAGAEKGGEIVVKDDGLVYALGL